MMYGTKMVKVYLFGFRLCIFSLMVNLLVSAMQPPKALANPANESQAANPTVSPTALEPEILSEINRVRTNPQGYAQWLEEQQQYYDGIWLRLPGEKPVRTNKGRKALFEAISILKTQQPLPPLSISEQTAATATSKLEDFATANNIQYISYGRVTAKGIVMGLVVDDLFPDRRRRNNLLNPDVENTGVVCKPDPRYARVCAIAYSDTTADIAEAEPPNTSQEVATATPNSDSDAEAERPATDTTPPVETTPTPPSPQDNTTNADLPQPSPPKVPPVLPTPSEPEKVEVEAPQEVEVSQAQEDAEVEPAQTDQEVEVEEVEVEPPQEVEVSQAQEDAEVEEVEVEPPQTDQEVEVEEVEVEPPQEVEVSQAQEDAEVEPAQTDEELEFESEELEDTEESEIAANSTVTDLLERVERGSLEQGDRVISDDGSLYDSYPIEGKAGESFNISLESDEFDAFVALIDAKGNIVDQNDDISQEDSNSRIRVTLPEDGIYNVIVNTYDEGGTGKYVLTVSR